LPVTLIVKLKSPEFVRVSERRVPDIEGERPEGNVPKVFLHVYGVAPPVAENVVVYVVLVLIATRNRRGGGNGRRLASGSYSWASV